MGEVMEMRPARISASSSPTIWYFTRAAVVLVFELHGGAEHHLARIREAAGVDDLRGAELALDLADAPFDEALLLARGVILGVLRKIAVAARLGDGLDDIRARFGLQLLQLGAQRLGATHGHGRAFHARMPSM